MRPERNKRRCAETFLSCRCDLRAGHKGEHRARTVTVWKRLGDLVSQGTSVPARSKR